MSRTYVYQCHAWPTSAASIPRRVVASVQPYSSRLVFLTLTTIFLDIQTHDGGPPPITRAFEFCYPISQLSELVRSAQIAICGMLCDLSGSHIPALRDLTVKLMACITDVVTNPDNSGRTVLPLAALFSCTRIAPTTALPPTPETMVEEEEEEEEEEDDDEETEAEDEDEEEEEEEEEEEVKEDNYQLRKSPLVTMLATDDIQCSICLADVQAGSMGSRLICYHWFHEECVLEWLTYDFSCPNCRFRFDS